MADFPIPASTPDNTKPGDVASFEYSDLVFTNWPRYSPDSLVRRHGLGIYSKMRLDEQVKAVVTFKRDAVLSRGWVFEFDKGTKLSEEQQEERIRVYEQLVARMPGSFIDALNGIATGREYGYSVTEKVYDVVEIDGKAYVGLRALLPRDPEYIEFTTTPQGALVTVKQKVAGREVVLDWGKFVHYVHNPEFDRYYGRSDLREAYRSWYMKDVLIKHWAMYMEKLGGGVVVAKAVDDSAPQYGTPQYTALQNVLANMRNSASIYLPKGVELDIKFPASTSEYRESCDWHDLAIARALLVPNLLGVSHNGETGAYAQSQTQLETFFWTIRADSMRLESCLNEQLFNDLGEQNWGDGEYPRFCFKPVSQEQIRWVVATWQALAGAKVVTPTKQDEARLREILEMPPIDEDAEPLVDPEAEAERIANEKIAAQGAKDKGEADERERTLQSRIDKLETMVVELSKRGGDSSAQRQEGQGRQEVLKFSVAKAMERVDFAVIDQRQSAAQSMLAAELSDAVARTTARLLGGDDHVQSLLTTNVEDIASIEFSGNEKGKLKQLCQQALKSSWATGASMATREVERVKRMPMIRANMASLKNVAASFIEQNGFRMAGNVSDAARATIQQELGAALKAGRSVKDTRVAIWERLVEKGITSQKSVRGTETDEAVLSALNELWVDTEEQAASYLETLARTNLFEAMNEARYAEFTDPELDGFVVAFRYSSILDDRTSDICAELHDAVFGVDSEVWDTYRPPNHYNCRSVLVPITQADEWDGEESPDPTVQPQADFK